VVRELCGSSPGCYPLLPPAVEARGSGDEHGLSSQMAGAGPGLVVPHWALAIARFCTTPQSPVR
jgi:hypothetical protein